MGVSGSSIADEKIDLNKLSLWLVYICAMKDIYGRDIYLLCGVGKDRGLSTMPFLGWNLYGSSWVTMDGNVVENTLTHMNIDIVEIPVN
jgi:hypothetical protein